MAEEVMTPKKSHNVKTVLGIILIVLLLPIFVFNLIIIVKGAANPDTPATVFGCAPLVVDSGSMTPAIRTGDLVIVRKVNPSTLEVGDIISFTEEGNKGSTIIITHRISDICIDEDGKTYFVTKGDANNTTDKNVVYFENVVGIYSFKLDGLGDFALFVQTPVGMLCIIGIPILAFVIYDLVVYYLDNRKKKQKNQNLEKKTVDLANQNAELLAEIERLKNQNNIDK